jgi:glycosyltransferase involved in cell wall biosynthesis
MSKVRLFASVLVLVFVFLTLQTNLFDNSRVLSFFGFSPKKQVVTTEKRRNSEHEAIHFLFGTISGYLFDTWVGALIIGGIKETFDFGYNYYHHRINRSQIIHDGIVDPLFWVFGGFVGCFLLETSRDLIRRLREKSKHELPEIVNVEEGMFHKNPDNPFISVVIPALDEEKFIGRTLISLMNQSFKDYELIVVDNNSRDQTAKIAESFGARVIFECREGTGYSRQAGFTAARGSIIATTDADTILPSNWLSRILKEFESDPELVAFGGLYSLYNGPFLARFAVRYLIFIPWIFDRIFSGGWSIPGSNLAVRKEAFLRAGGFNTKLNLGEDAELSQRLKYIGRVKLDMGFRVKTSGRRYRWGLLIAMIEYFPNALARIFLGDPEKFSNLPRVREEKFVSDRYWLLWLASCLFIILAITPLDSPRVEAKVLRPIKERTVIFKRVIYSKEKDLIERIKTKKRSRLSNEWIKRLRK